MTRLSFIHRIEESNSHLMSIPTGKDSFENVHELWGDDICRTDTITALYEIPDRRSVRCIKVAKIGERGFIGYKILSCFKLEDCEHELVCDLTRPLHATRVGKLNSLTFEWPRRNFHRLVLRLSISFPNRLPMKGAGTYPIQRRVSRPFAKKKLDGAPRKVFRNEKLPGPTLQRLSSEIYLYLGLRAYRAFDYEISMRRGALKTVNNEPALAPPRQGQARKLIILRKYGYFVPFRTRQQSG